MAVAVAKEPPPCGQSCGCDANHQAPFPKWRIGRETYRTCPRWLVTPLSAELVSLYGHFQDGILPRTGGLLEQPNFFVEAVNIIRREEANGSES